MIHNRGNIKWNERKSGVIENIKRERCERNWKIESVRAKGNYNEREYKKENVRRERIEEIVKWDRMWCLRQWDEIE